MNQNHQFFLKVYIYEEKLRPCLYDLQAQKNLFCQTERTHRKSYNS